MDNRRVFEEEFKDLEDNMCNMSVADADDVGYDTDDEDDYDATKSIASTIDDFVERTPVNHIHTFREKIDKMRNSFVGQFLFIILILSLVISLLYWNETKEMICNYYTKIISTPESFRLSTDT